MATTQSTVKQKPVGITPHDHDWGVGVSGAEAPSSFERTNRILKRWWATDWSVDHERAVLVTEAYKKHVGLTQQLKVAQVLADLMEKASIWIADDELIVGGIAAPLKGAPVFPEFSYDWVTGELENNPFNDRHYTAHVTSDETHEALMGIADFWKGQTVEDEAYSMMTEEQRKTSHLGKGVFSLQLYLHGGIGHFCPNFEEALRLGLGGLRERLEQKLAGCDITLPEGIKQRDFYRSELVVLDALSGYCRRFAMLAVEEAKSATIERKKELLQISEICSHVATEPPRNLWEALQLVTFIYNQLMIESNGHSVSYGRMDQFLNRFYEADKVTGTAKEWQQELIESFYLKGCEMCKIRDWGTVAMNGGHGMGGDTITLGGVDRAGNDATNDLTYILIDALMNTRLASPWLAVRWHEGSPEELKIKCASAIRAGLGRPKLFNDKVCIAAMEGYGRSQEDSRDYAVVGCVELDAAGKEYGWHDAAYFSLAKVLELTINNGRCLECDSVAEYLCPLYSECAAKGKRLGIETGSLSEFKTIDEVKEAYDKQMKYMCDLVVGLINVTDIAHQRKKPVPAVSLFLEGCAESGVDASAGGAKYNFSGPQALGVASVADGLAAIQQLMFDENRISGEEFLQALKNNWQGYEWLQALINSDKVRHYGNDDDYVDDLAVFGSDTYCKHIEKRPNAHGGVFVPGVYSVTANVGFGLILWATPDGRSAMEPVSDNCGAVHNQLGNHDTSGPTAMLKSVCKLDHERMANGTLLNLKFTPSTVTGETGREAFINLTESFFEMGGMECQTNVLSRETLEDAYENPDAHRNLLVRVAGYSAFFNDLGPQTKLDIIDRTELSFD